MIAIVCIDDSGGMLFNRRRQSQDRLLREDLLREAAGKTLWMNAYSARQFKGALPETVRAEEDFLDRAGSGELCFVENRDLAPYAGKLEGLIVYRWNRQYPADLFFTVPLENWTLVRQEEFAGSSHEKITKEVYSK
ncbi:MAG: ribonuclease Z [Oscillospiraceae bacterium]|nr:ribonuclease Z [Oscillospiraceae bacterium]